MQRTSITDIVTGFRDRAAIVFHGRSVDYAEFAVLIGLKRGLIEDHALKPGTVVAFDGVYTPENCALLVALVEAGMILVPLPVGPEAKRAEFMAVAEVEALIVADGAGAISLETTGRRADHETYRRLRDADVPGLVLFSSGTTGRSKGSVLNFARLVDNYDRSKLRPRRTLAFLSLDHIGGINTLMSTLVHGGCIVTIAERTPKAVFTAIERHGVDTLPTTPTFLTMSLISGELARHNLSSLRLVTYGTEPMPSQTLDKLNAVMPQVRLKQTYGLSEVGILPTVSKSNSSLFMKLGTHGFEHKIVDGILWIRSDMAMLGYLNAPSPYDEEGYFNTQDAVEVDGEYIKVLGRRSEIINVGGEKVYPNEVESVLLEIEGVDEVTVSGRASPVVGMVVRAVLKLAAPEPIEVTRRRVREHCLSRLEPFKTPVVIEVTEEAMHSDRLKKLRAA